MACEEKGSPMSFDDERDEPATTPGMPRPPQWAIELSTEVHMCNRKLDSVREELSALKVQVARHDAVITKAGLVSGGVGISLVLIVQELAPLLFRLLGK